jgi:hypothetical protein
VSTAVVESDGEVRQLDGKAGTPIVVTAEDVQDPAKLARMLQTAMRELAELRRRYNPRVTYLRDVAVTNTGAVLYRFAHGFGGRVNWYVAQWDPASVGTEVRLDQHADTDANTLVLVSGASGRVTVKVEEAG